MRRGIIRVFFFCLLIILSHSGIGSVLAEENSGSGDPVVEVTVDTGEGSPGDSVSDDTVDTGEG
ncbi:MAG: hypothetical protein LUQ07_04190, partial [Methanospirillum sp.]|nr:hypothetical protein [Methanospirillum sp.]